MRMRTCSALLALGSLVLSLGASAEPRFARLYKQQYGYPPSCHACHKDGGGTPLNGYGEAWKAAGSTVGAFAAIGAQDSDGDGADNASEARGKANPGQARSTPQDPGDWLDTANLIPREVQGVFPGVTAYKPLDTILTDKELARAQAMGVQLGPEDETTIYVPVKDGKAAGTAIIVPAWFQGEQFFVLLATNRQLEVSHALAMHAGKVDGAGDPALYAGAIGKPVEELPAGGEGSLAAAVAAALKRAGVLLHVRLKPA